MSVVGVGNTPCVIPQSSKTINDDILYYDDDWGFESSVLASSTTTATTTTTTETANRESRNLQIVSTMVFASSISSIVEVATCPFCANDVVTLAQNIQTVATSTAFAQALVTASGTFFASANQFSGFPSFTGISNIGVKQLQTASPTLRPTVVSNNARSSSEMALKIKLAIGLGIAGACLCCCFFVLVKVKNYYEHRNFNFEANVNANANANANTNHVAATHMGTYGGYNMSQHLPTAPVSYVKAPGISNADGYGYGGDTSFVEVVAISMSSYDDQPQPSHDGRGGHDSDGDSDGDGGGGRGHVEGVPSYRSNQYQPANSTFVMPAEPTSRSWFGGRGGGNHASSNNQTYSISTSTSTSSSTSNSRPTPQFKEYLDARRAI